MEEMVRGMIKKMKKIIENIKEVFKKLFKGRNLKHGTNAVLLILMVLGIIW